MGNTALPTVPAECGTDGAQCICGDASRCCGRSRTRGFSCLLICMLASSFLGRVPPASVGPLTAYLRCDGAKVRSFKLHLLDESATRVSPVAHRRDQVRYYH